jgi:hypothetical protein
MNGLLQKYFRGETTLNEEKELKKYFRTGKVRPEHESYRVLFEAFDEELNETASSPLKKVLPLQRDKKHYFIRVISYSGIAAALALTLWVIRPGTNDDYAIIRGKRIDNPEFAQQYAQNKLDIVNDKLMKSMKPFQSLEKVRNSLKPIQKLAETKERIREINEKLQ